MKINNLIQKRDARTATPATDNPNGSGNQHHQRIATAAFVLFERRGRQAGHELDDWLAAEQQILRGDVPKTFEDVQQMGREARLRRENVRLKRLLGERILELTNDEEVWA